MRAKLASGLLATVVFLALSPRAAVANVDAFYDNKNDADNHADFRKMKVVLQEGSLDVHMVFRHRKDGAFRLFIDVPKRKGKPNFQFTMDFADTARSLTRTTGWKPGSKQVECAEGDRWTVEQSGATTYVNIPDSCLGNPSKVRVGMKTYWFDKEGSRHTADWLYGHRTLTTWVHDGV